MSALPPKADMCGATQHVRFVPIADIAPVNYNAFDIPFSEVLRGESRGHGSAQSSTNDRSSSIGSLAMSSKSQFSHPHDLEDDRNRPADQ